VTFPLTTVPPVGSDCASDGCAQPRLNSAITLTEARNSLPLGLMADAGPHVDLDETINRTNHALKGGRAVPSLQILCQTCTAPYAVTVAGSNLRMHQPTWAIFRKIVNDERWRPPSGVARV